MYQGGPDKGGGDSGEGEGSQINDRMDGSSRVLPAGHQVLPKYGQPPIFRQPQTAELVSLAANKAISLGNIGKSR